MTYKAIFEIGPIFDYVQSTRKTRDLWGASFLFSYLMGICAKAILENEIPGFSFAAHGGKISAIISRPSLKGDILFKAIFNAGLKDVQAGTIPDLLYCQLEKKNTPQKVKAAFENELDSLFKKAKTKVEEYYQSDFENNDKSGLIAFEQLKEYFRLFYVTGETEDFDELEQIAYSRSRIFEFNETKDSVNTTNNKYDRCLLCGDRKKVITLKNIRPGKNKPDEPLCAICTLKRGLLNVIKGAFPFPSTTKTASYYAKQALFDHFTIIRDDLFRLFQYQIEKEKVQLIDEIGVKNCEKLRNLIDNINKGKDNIGSKKFFDISSFINYQSFYTDNEITNRIRNTLDNEYKKELVKLEDKDKRADIRQKKLWLNRAFYAVVTLDADGMGGTLRKLAKQDKTKLAAEISAKLSQFAKGIAAKIDKDKGVLIYAGGEDVLFMIHPAFLLETVYAIAKEYHDRFSDGLDKEIETALGEVPQLTLSGGAYICYHKHPLKLAVQGVHRMEGVAKKQPGKNSLAIQLYKGSGERAEVVLPILPLENNFNFTISNYISLITDLLKADLEIPRGFVYKLSEEYEVMKSVIKDKQALLQYVRFILEKSGKYDSSIMEKLERLILSSLTCTDQGIEYRQLIDRLYFIRFLTEAEA